jgi:hypothetical protein
MSAMQVNGTEWVPVECPVCKGVFILLRRGTNLKQVESRNLRHKDGTSVQRNEVRRCDTCGVTGLPTSGIILLIIGTAQRAVA